MFRRIRAAATAAAGWPTIGAAAVGPNFLFTIGEDELYVELTTPGQIAPHAARAAFDARYAVAEILTYILLL